jgi:hypothetical protein
MTWSSLQENKSPWSLTWEKPSTIWTGTSYTKPNEMFLWHLGRAITRVPGISKRNRGQPRENPGNTDNGEANKIASCTTTCRASSSIESIRRTVGRESPPILRTHEKIRQEIWVDRISRCSICAFQESAFHATSAGHTQREGASTTVHCCHIPGD